MGEHQPTDESPDPLEAELTGLRPVRPSPALRGRIGRQLGERPRPALPWRLVVAGGMAVAACLVVTAILWRSSTRPAPTPGPREVVLQPPPTSRQVAAAWDAGLPPPTKRAYQQALARSPEAMDELLDRHAARLLRSAGPSGPADAITWSDTKHLTGDSL